MQRKPIICANFKCKIGKVEVAKQFAEEFNEGVDESSLAKTDVIFLPSPLHVWEVKRTLKDGAMIGLQNISTVESAEAFTGELTASMAKDVGCDWILVGHSDRRHRALDTTDDARAKFERAQDAGLAVLFCIGELLEDRENGRTLEVCQEQLSQVLPKVKDWGRFAIVYEPVWAMGTGVAATKEQAQEVHQAVRELVADKFGMPAANTVRIVYGGIVNPRSSEGFFSQPDIDGFCGQAAKPSDLAGIVRTCANSV